MTCFNVAPTARVVIIVSVIAASSSVRADDLQVTLQKWAARQQSTKSFSFDWDEKFTDLSTGVQREAFNRRSFSNLDDWVRFKTTGGTYQGDQLLQRDTDSGYNGEECRVITKARDGLSHPVGVIFPEDDHLGDVKLVHSTPVLLALRPLDSRLKGMNTKDLKLTGRSGSIDGSTCSIIEYPEPHGRKCELWVDGQQDAGIRRVRHLRPDLSLSRQIDISYSQGENAQWLPSGWIITTFGPDNRVRHIYTATVTAKELNPPLQRSDFLPEFPIGAIITDARRPNSGFLVKEDGSRRDLTPAEARSATYDQLVATDTGQALNVTTRSRANLTLVVITVGVIFVLAALVIRRRLAGASNL